jgi:hypothetical protein
VTEVSTNEKPGTSKGTGCLVACLILLGLAVWSVWQIREPGKHAAQMRSLIGRGMPLEKVESLLTSQDNRHYIFYQLSTNGGWNMVSRDQFIFAFNSQTNGPAPSARVHLIFMGVAPGRMSFFVEFDSTGRVSNITVPYLRD